MKKITYTINENGLPIGEAHHNAVLTDEDVELIRDIYDEGFTSYSTLAEVFEVSKSTIRNVVKYRKRATTPAGYRTVDAAGRRPLPKSRLARLGIEIETLDALEEWDNEH